MLKKILYRYIIPPVVFILIYLISATLKLTIINRKVEEELVERGQNAIYTLWHGRLFFFAYLYRFLPGHVILVSPSSDGDIISRTLNLFGLETIRGSSYKKGREAFWKLSKALDEGKKVLLVGDGSRGPRYKLQKGVVVLAQKKGLPIIPVMFGAKNKKIFSTWDRFLVPYPFSPATVIYGETVSIGQDDLIEEKMAEVESSLNRIMNQVDRGKSGQL